MDFSEFKGGNLIPVAVCENQKQVETAVEGLKVAGILTIEITLRTPQALALIKYVAKRYPEVYVGAGTVLNGAQWREAVAHGARFCVSPGVLPSLLAIAKNSKTPYLPGISTPSEIMVALEHGFQSVKVFPAESLGGAPFLKSLAATFPSVRFCPSGGIEVTHLQGYLDIPAIFAVGGGFLLPPKALKEGDVDAVAGRCLEALMVMRSGHLRALDAS